MHLYSRIFYFLAFSLGFGNFYSYASTETQVTKNSYFGTSFTSFEKSSTEEPVLIDYNTFSLQQGGSFNFVNSQGTVIAKAASFGWSWKNRHSFEFTDLQNDQKFYVVRNSLSPSEYFVFQEGESVGYFLIISPEPRAKIIFFNHSDEEVASLVSNKKEWSIHRSTNAPVSDLLLGAVAAFHSRAHFLSKVSKLGRWIALPVAAIAMGGFAYKKFKSPIPAVPAQPKPKTANRDAGIIDLSDNMASEQALFRSHFDSLELAKTLHFHPLEMLSLRINLERGESLPEEWESDSLLKKYAEAIKNKKAFGEPIPTTKSVAFHLDRLFRTIDSEEKAKCKSKLCNIILDSMPASKPRDWDLIEKILSKWEIEIKKAPKDDFNPDRIRFKGFYQTRDFLLSVINDIRSGIEKDRKLRISDIQAVVRPDLSSAYALQLENVRDKISALSVTAQQSAARFKDSLKIKLAALAKIKMRFPSDLLKEKHPGVVKEFVDEFDKSLQNEDEASEVQNELEDAAHALAVKELYLELKIEESSILNKSFIVEEKERLKLYFISLGGFLDELSWKIRVIQGQEPDSLSTRDKAEPLVFAKPEVEYYKELFEEFDLQQKAYLKQVFVIEHGICPDHSWVSRYVKLGSSVFNHIALLKDYKNEDRIRISMVNWRLFPSPHPMAHVQSVNFFQSKETLLLALEAAKRELSL